MKTIVIIMILLSITALKVGAQTYRTDTLNDSVQTILPSYDGSRPLHVKGEIRRTDNSKSVGKGLDSIYTIKYVYTISNDEDDYFDERLQSLKEQVQKGTRFDKYGRTRAILDSTITSDKKLSFSYLPILHRNIFDVSIEADGMRHSEYAFTKITIDKDTSNITISFSVKNIISHGGGGIANSSWQDTIPIVECIKLDREKINYLVDYFNIYSNRTAVRLWNFLNGRSIDLFKRAGRFFADDKKLRD